MNDPGVHLNERGLVIGNIGVHRTNDAAIIDDAGKVGKGFANFDAALAALLEFEGRGHETCTGALFVECAVRLLAFVFFKSRFGIESIDVRWATVEKEENGAFGTGTRMIAAGHGKGLGAKEAGEAEQAETGAGFLQHLPPGETRDARER